MPSGCHRHGGAIVALLALAATVTPARRAAADETPAAPPPAETPTAALSADSEFSTDYVFRGINMFGEHQGDANGLVAPSLGLAFPASGVSVGLWTGWQWSGNNIARKLRAGSGGEVNLWTSYDAKLLDDALDLTATLLWFFYPAATAQDAGTVLPSYVEPTAVLSWSGVVDLSLKVLYSAAVQDAIACYRYLYFRPAIARTVDVGAGGSMEFALGLGYKLFHGHPAPDGNNVWDVQFDWRWNVPLGGAVRLRPAFHIAWTNLSGIATSGEFVYWAGFDLGYGD